MILAISRQMLVHLGFSKSAANDIYQRQGIDSIDEWANFENDYVVSLLRSVRKSGGSGNGEMVVLKADLNFQLAVLFIHQNIRTNRTVDYGDITVPDIRALKKQREIEAIKEPKTEALTINLKYFLKTYESLNQYLRRIRGGNRVLLSYVVRASNEEHLKPSVDDPVTSYATHDEDMAKRAPIIAAANSLGTENMAPLTTTLSLIEESYGILYPHLSSKHRPGQK